jgi:hypothetical protein
VKTQKKGNVRGKGIQEGGRKNRSDPVVLTTAPFRIWDALKHFHPHSKEILTLARILSRMGAKRTMIAAALSLQEWQEFCGVCDWTAEDVKGLFKGYSL